MNKKLIVILLLISAVMLLPMSGCGCQQNSVETNAPETTVPPTTMVPGVVYNPDGGIEDLDDVESTTAPADTTPVETAPEATKDNQGSNSQPGKDEEPEATTAPTTGKDEEPEETTAPTTGKDETPEETTSPTTEKNEDPTVPTTGETVTAYEQYNSMSGKAQKEFIESFDSIEDFFVWYNNAKAEYEKLNPDIEVSDGTVDLGG